jgi:RNA polymerase sigma factor (sigma-70 family)
MASGSLARALDRLHRTSGLGSLRERTDVQLLEGFADRGEETAFEELVRRHGPMVFGVCRRLLGAAADADDAFQAVFLVLVLRARSIRKRASVGSWLYGVAYRVASRARADARRRHTAHRRLGPPREEPPAETSSTEELRPVLDEELERLPDKYRAPLVLCYLQGKTNEQAARELGWPSGSMSRRLARARELLRRRLVRRGVALSAGGALTAAVPEALAQATLRAGREAAAGGTVPPVAAALAKGVIHTMFVTRVKTFLLGVLVVALLGAAGGLLIHRGAAAAPAGQALPGPAPAARTGQEGQAPKEKAGGDKEAPKGKEKAGAAPKGEIFALAYSPDGQIVAAAMADKVELVEIATGKPARQFGPGARALALSPDGRLLASAGRKGDKQVHLVNPGTGQEIRVLDGHTEEVTGVVFSPDGKIGASASKDKSVRLWDLATGREIRQLGGTDGEVLSLAYSPDGVTIVSGDADGTLLLWDVATGKLLAKTLGHKGAVTSLAISPDSRTVASAGADGTVRLWELDTGKAVAKLDGHAGGAWSVAYAPDGTHIVATGKDNKVRLWNVGSGEGTELPGEAVRVRAARFSPDGRLVVFGSGGALRIWDIARKAYVAPGGK